MPVMAALSPVVAGPGSPNRAAVLGDGIVLTGRTDNYLQGRPDLDDTIRRLTAFADVGADVLYAPYPTDLAAVSAIVKAVAPKPAQATLANGRLAVTLPPKSVTVIGVRP